MGKLKRNFWGGYYRTPIDSHNALLGAELYHAYLCGTFEKDGVRYNLTYFFLCKDDLPDTQGKNQEAFDLAAVYADDILENGIEASLPSVHTLIAEDTAAGLDGWDILEKRVGVMVQEFLGFTFEEVLTEHPEILQPYESNDPETGETHSSVNIRSFTLYQA